MVLGRSSWLHRGENSVWEERDHVMPVGDSVPSRSYNHRSARYGDESEALQLYSDHRRHTAKQARMSIRLITSVSVACSSMRSGNRASQGFHPFGTTNAIEGDMAVVSLLRKCKRIEPERH